MNIAETKNALIKYLNDTERDESVVGALGFMALLRTYAESQEYSCHNIIKLYCNWTLHPDLHYNSCEERIYIFEFLTKEISNNWGDNPKIISTATEAIGFERFKNELEAYLRSELADGLYSDLEIISNFLLKSIIYIILNRPVSLNSKTKTYLQNKDKTGQLTNVTSSDGEPVWISKIELTSIDGNVILDVYVTPPPPKHENTSSPFRRFQLAEID
ncbi:hypothetical protein COB18_02320 [Candidatus Kaiserbacteria bacterium]|nr:MAG: hypothetical protein COB18_02320 [Candidatus Kaiserbacteria bacterium]